MENEKNLEEGLQETMPAAEPVPEEETVPAEPVTAEEAPAAEETAAEEIPAEEAVEEAAAEEEMPAEKKATPGKIAVMVTAIVLVVALIAGLLMTGSKIPPAAETAPAETGETVPPATVPADGNPDDETCKGTYTVTDEEVVANADTVVATMGEHTLTNGQLQVMYWMNVQSFLSSQYGSYMMYYGQLDYTQPLDTQISPMQENGGTWQQFFLQEALTTWQKYCVLAEKAQQAGMELTEEEQATLDGIEENMLANAQYYGLESVEELLKYNVGAGADLDDYTHFQKLIVMGNKFYDAEYAKLSYTQEELEAFFAENETMYADSGITKDGKYVNVRHILFVPEGGTTDEATGQTTYSEEEWEACRVKAEDMLAMWTAGAQTEESFGALATAMTQDPGSKETGGLYENVTQGQMVEEFDAWCFDEARQTGDHGIVKTTYGYHVMYFVSSTPIWEYYARQDLMTEKSGVMLDELVAPYSMDVDYSAITLGYVNMAG